MTEKREMIENLKTIRRACANLSSETSDDFGELVGRINEEIRLLEDSSFEKSAVKSTQKRMLSEKESMSKEKRRKIDDEIEELGGLKEVQV